MIFPSPPSGGERSEEEMCDNSKLHYIFYDTFDDTYVEKRDMNAPPERYVIFFRGVENDLFTESWWTTDPDDRVLSIAYSKDDLRIEGIDRLRRNAEKSYNVRMQRMRHMTIPPSEFDELVNSLKTQSI